MLHHQRPDVVVEEIRQLMERPFPPAEIAGAVAESAAI
jgi:hypothetical protein